MSFDASPRSDIAEPASTVRVGARVAGSTLASLTKRPLSLLFVVSLVGAGVWVYSSVQGRANAPAYRLARVEHGALTSAVAATGSLNAVTGQHQAHQAQQAQQAEHCGRWVLLRYLRQVEAAYPQARRIFVVLANWKLCVGF